MTRECGWCGAEFEINPGPGRPRKYCKQGCRQQAYVTRLRPYNIGTLRAWADRFGNECYMCGLELTFGVDLEFDHVTPGSKGGVDLLWNLRPVCHTCNLKKAAQIRYIPILVEG